MKKRKIRKDVRDCIVICGVGLCISSMFTLAIAGFGTDNANSLIGADVWYAKNVEVVHVEAEENDILVEEASEIDEELTIEEKIKSACTYYEIPYDICLAIARLETGWFTSDAYIYGNNPGGMSINEEPIRYDSIDEGVDAFISNLACNYFSIGLDTPEKIGAKYCPSNPDWDDVVVQLMEMEEEK